MGLNVEGGWKKLERTVGGARHDVGCLFQRLGSTLFVYYFINITIIATGLENTIEMGSSPFAQLTGYYQ